MRVSSNSFTSTFLNEVNQLQQQQNTLQQESSTGLKVTNPEDDPTAMGQVLNLQANASANTQYQANITAQQAAATTSAAAMNSLQTICNQVNEIATQASSGTTSSTQLSAYATQVSSLLQQAVAIGNTKDANGDYIFGGTKGSSPPFTATTNSSGNITAVTYNGNTQVSHVEVAGNITVAAQTLGANTTGSGATGLFVNSSSGADLFSHMISLQSDLASGNTTAISSTDAPALSKDETNIVNCISANSVTQATLTTASNMVSAQSANDTTDISNDSSADLATTLTQLSQTQTAYQAALESGTMIFNLSILSYIQ